MSLPRCGDPRRLNNVVSAFALSPPLDPVEPLAPRERDDRQSEQVGAHLAELHLPSMVRRISPPSGFVQREQTATCAFSCIRQSSETSRRPPSHAGILIDMLW